MGPDSVMGSLIKAQEMQPFVLGGVIDVIDDQSTPCQSKAILN